MSDTKRLTTTEKMNSGTSKQTKGSQSPLLRKLQLWSALGAFIFGNALKALGKRMYAHLLSPETGGRLSKTLHAVFAAVTLEGPRLMLISRYRAARMERGKKIAISSGGGSVAAVIIVATILAASQLFAVSVNGKVIGYVTDEGQYMTLVQRAKEKISEQVGTENTEILIEDTNISLDPVIAPQQQPLVPVSGDAAQTESTGTPGSASAAPAADTGEDAMADLFVDSLLNDGAVKATLYMINVNGKTMATLGTMKEASQVLQKIADTFTPANGEYTGKFTDDITIEGGTTELSGVNLQSPDDVVAYLLAGTTAEKSYTAIEKDTLENICASLGITAQELRTEYPEYDFTKIKEGDVFATSMNIPYVHYEITGVEVSNDPIPYETIDEKSDELFLGQREIKVAGELGVRRVTRQVTRLNGELIASTETFAELVKEPSTETVLVGTKMVQMGDTYVGPSDGWGGGGSGPLGRPLNSWYLTRGISAGHNGDDMIAPRGTPIFAAESGTVTFVGYYGGYGNLVIVDHGNGLETYYAHCDTFNTTEGAVVQRGQQIATVGITGRATAYHLHFEVRVNGVPQEPLDWIG